MWLYVNNNFEMALTENGKFNKKFVETPFAEFSNIG